MNDALLTNLDIVDTSNEYYSFPFDVRIQSGEG